MQGWMWISTLATLLPMAALGTWAWPALKERWRQSRPSAKIGLVLLWFLGSAFLLARPHEDCFTGLDNMTYRQLAHAFLEGRGFHDPDRVLEQVPKDLREDFLFYRGPAGRPTRDRAFQLSGWREVETEPFFMPTLSLAAAGLEPALAPERFVPLMGSLWLALVLAAAFCGGGGWGLAAGLALVAGTAWPAWFLRGFYAEGVGALLVGGVAAVSAVRPLRGGMSAWAGFALGLAVTYHPTLVALSVPVALGLIMERRDGKSAAWLAAGMLAGLFPFWALTRWVCQPYGNWTYWQNLRQMLFFSPEHQAIGIVLGGGMLVSSVALWAGFCPAVRRWIRRMDAGLAPWGWLAICALPLAGMAALPGFAGEAIRRGAAAAWSGIRWPYALLLLAAAGAVAAGRRPIRERFWLAVLCGSALFFFFLKGVEVPVGLWSQRRFLPVPLMAIALLAAPLSAALGAIRRRGARGLAVLALLVAGGANLVRWPAAYATVNEKGATDWTRAMADRMGTHRWVVFDYYPHSVPYAAGLKHRVLGLGRGSWGWWPEVAAWLAPLAQSEEVWVVTSSTPCPLEDGFRFEEVFSTTGHFPVANAKAFFPAERGERVVAHHVLRVVPLVPGERAVQDKTLDESPIGLLGRWGSAKDSGAARPARWTRQDSGIVGPIPPPGGRVAFRIECAFFGPGPEWTKQTLRILPPWGGEPARVEVSNGWQTVETALERPANDAERASTGAYSLSVERPYDPAEYGLRGYSSDLGVQIRRLIIRIEQPGLSMPH